MFLQVLVKVIRFLTELLSLSEHIIGDFNVPDINWSSLTGVSLFPKLNLSLIRNLGGPNILKKCALVLYQPVHYIFSLSGGSSNYT